MAPSIEQKIAQIDRSMAIEGMPLKPQDRARIRDCYTGKTTFEQARKVLLEKYRVKEP